MSNSLSQPVSPGDLILIHGGNAKPRMLVVTSAPETTLTVNLEKTVKIEHITDDDKPKSDSYSATDKKPPVRSISPALETPVKVESVPLDLKNNLHISSIKVQEVQQHIPDHKGFFALSGPDAYYVHSSETECDRRCGFDDEHRRAERPEPTDLLANYVTSDDVQMITNPHGRDVIKHYFSGSCPYCCSDRWFCPGCGGVSKVWPDLFASCGRDQSCPVCLGYQFALRDKSYLDSLESYEDKLAFRKDGDSLQSLKKEAVELVRERYQLIDCRAREMDLRGVNVEEQCRKWTETWTEDLDDSDLYHAGGSDDDHDED